MNASINKIAVLTSGGDAPGMNAAIRAVVRTALFHNIEVFGVNRGYSGMIDDDIVSMNSRSVANIRQRGATILKTARSKEVFTPEGRSIAAANLRKRGIDGIVVIGGDGSFTGAAKLNAEHGISCVGLPGTIDKDLYGTDFTIGFDTAVNTAIECIDKIRDTMDAHDRLFIVEVMGRHAGYIALYSGIGTGAENILLPEASVGIEDIIQSLTEKEKRKKLVNLLVVAEGYCPDPKKPTEKGAEAISRIIKSKLPTVDTRVTIIGHIQRGGAPSSMDRFIASRMGYHAVECLIEGRNNVMVGILNNKMHYTPITETVSKKQRLNEDWMKIVKILAS